MRRRTKARALNLEEAALGYLERYSASVSRVRRVLMRRIRRAHGGDPAALERAAAEVGPLLERLVRAGLLDDRNYARGQAESLARAGASRRLIRAKLMERGVAAAEIDGALESLGSSELESARAYARRRRLGPYRSAEERPGRRDRDLAALARRGFSLGVARAVIDAAE